MRKKVMSFYFLFFLYLNIIFIPLSWNVFQKEEKGTFSKDLKLNSTGIDPTIFINGNSGWEVIKAAGNCTGNGTHSNPYIIKDLVIDGGGLEPCFTIKNSDAFFRIENCSAFNSTGFSIMNTSNWELFDNNCLFNNIGINLVRCENFNVSRNSACYSEKGIYLQDCSNGILKDNNCSNNVFFGIESTFFCENITFSGNTVLYNICGISMVFDYDDYEPEGEIKNFNVLGNNICYNLNGIFMLNSNNVTISNNDISFNEFYGIWGYEGDIIVVGNSICYNGVNGVDKGGYNVIVKGNAVNNNGENGMVISDNKNGIISGNIADNNRYSGIELRRSSNVSVIGNEANSNGENGLMIHQSVECFISENDANYNGYKGLEWIILDKNNGINLVDSVNNTISGNNASFNTANGIFLRDTNGTFISENIVENNPNNGIHLKSGNNNTIKENNASINGNSGIFLMENSDGNVISDNTAENNNYGIRLKCSYFNDVFDNTLFNNYIADYYDGDCQEFVPAGNTMFFLISILSVAFAIISVTIGTRYVVKRSFITDEVERSNSKPD